MHKMDTFHLFVCSVKCLCNDIWVSCKAYVIGYIDECWKYLLRIGGRLSDTIELKIGKKLLTRLFIRVKND